MSEDGLIIKAEAVEGNANSVNEPEKSPNEQKEVGAADQIDQHPEPESAVKPKAGTPSPPDLAQMTTEQLLAVAVNKLEETNKFLKTLQTQGEATAQARKDDEWDRKVKDSNDERRDYASWTYQFISSGSIIAIFLSALNVALLSYANDIRSERDPPTPLTSTDKLTISCWVVSLVVSLGVVTTGSVWSFIYLWVTATRNTRTEFWHGPWVALDYTRRPPNIADADSAVSSMNDYELYSVMSRFQTSSLISGIAFGFNLLVLPALLATIIGCVIFVWAEQPRLAAVSTSAFGATILFAFLVVVGIVVWMAYDRVRSIRITYEEWDEENARLQKAKNK